MGHVAASWWRSFQESASHLGPPPPQHPNRHLPTPTTPSAQPGVTGVADKFPRWDWSKAPSGLPVCCLLSPSPTLNLIFSHCPFPRAPCRSLWTTYLRPCSALCTGAALSPWPSSTCLTSWMSRQTDTASMTQMCGTPGKATGNPWGAQREV